MSFAIVGAAGKVGFATAEALRAAGAPVRAIIRDQAKAARLHDIGCEVVLADIQDSERLALAIGDAESVQIIIPPAPQAEDTAKQMRNDIETVAAALGLAKPKRILAISDYGAHVAHDIGMPTMCQNFERRIAQLDGHKLFLRSAEHMQGWARSIPAALESGVLKTFHDPIDMPLPMVSAPDVGRISAELLLQSEEEWKDNPTFVHAEGPRRYSANNVATALSELVGRKINVETVPRSLWKAAFEGVMSPSLAELLIKANDAQNIGGLVDVEPNSKEIRHGTTDLIDVLRSLIPQ